MALKAKVTLVDMDGKENTFECPAGTTVLEAAEAAGLSLPHDCRMGVCMTCPSKLRSGSLDQSSGMLDEDTIQKGYALTCISEPQSDCVIDLIEEEELLSLALG